MKVRLLTTLGILFLMTLTVSASGPRLELDKTEFDFGLIPSGQTVSHVFWLKAAGTEPLKILQVKASCGCTKAPIEKSELAPGDSTRLEVIFNSRKFRGTVSKTVRIFTNEAEQPQMVKITGKIENNSEGTRPLLIEPRLIELSSKPQKGLQKHTFTLTNQTDRRLVLQLVDWPRDLVKLDLPEYLAAGETVTVPTMLGHEAVNLPFEKSFTIEVGGPTTTRFTIPIIKKAPSLSRR